MHLGFFQAEETKAWQEMEELHDMQSKAELSPDPGIQKTLLSLLAVV